MIKANELRIGNYFIDAKGRLCTVDVVSADMEETIITVKRGALTTLPIKPIPLTEEWLLKFGYSEIEFSIPKKYRNHSRVSLRCNFDDERLFYDGRQIQYVHQLQNLYFALCGEELTIKE